MHKLVPHGFRDRYLRSSARRNLPQLAFDFGQRDARDALTEDRDPEKTISAAITWLCRAQDHSATDDGGVARHYSLVDGWAPSYPETTGYIVPTFLDEADRSGDASLTSRARHMLDWLVGIQRPDGGFQGGTILHTPRVPVTFNTGQVLIGLAIAARRLAEWRYLDAMHRAAEWLVRTQDPDGCWRRYPTPWARPGEKTYETHASWGLFEAERTARGYGYGNAGVKQVRWALSRQRANGWFEDSCLNRARAPLTHTIGYTLRGVLEAYRLTHDLEFLYAAAKTGQALVRCSEPDGRLAGRLDAKWQPVVDWVCLTGSAQIGHSMLILWEFTGDRAFLEAGRRLIRFVRRTVILDDDANVVGGIRGSFPISGDYCPFEFISWAAKFFIDASRQDLSMEESDWVRRASPRVRQVRGPRVAHSPEA